MPIPKASTSNGYMVPTNTAAVAVSKIMLFSNNAVSRENQVKRPVHVTVPERQAYSASEPPTTTHRKIRRKTPRDGSVAKACTETSTQIGRAHV